jgi:hypothetical protein
MQRIWRKSEAKGQRLRACGLLFSGKHCGLFQRGESALNALEEVHSFTRKSGTRDFRGPAGESLTIRRKSDIAAVQKPEKSFVIGFSDQAR